MEHCTVLYEGWQMQCCGTPFSTGGTVSWLVCTGEGVRLPIDAGNIDYCYDAHSQFDKRKLYVLEGRVTHIKALYCEYAPSKQDPKLLIAVNGTLINTDSANGWDKPLGNMEFDSYIVELENCSIRPAERGDVTFC